MHTLLSLTQSHVRVDLNCTRPNSSWPFGMVIAEITTTQITELSSVGLHLQRPLLLASRRAFILKWHTGMTPYFLLALDCGGVSTPCAHTQPARVCRAARRRSAAVWTGHCLPAERLPPRPQPSLTAGLCSTSSPPSARRRSPAVERGGRGGLSAARLLPSSMSCQCG